MRRRKGDAPPRGRGEPTAAKDATGPPERAPDSEAPTVLGGRNERDRPEDEGEAPTVLGESPGAAGDAGPGEGEAPTVHGEAGGEAPTFAGKPLPREPEGADQAGRVIDKFRLVRLVGQGGMGEVWEAEQREPVRRTVALKLIKRGMDSAEVVSRFESERQALALMDHPSIARVYDAGTTPGGRPYFVMEYIDGTPFTDYCDEQHLGVHDRLDLFMQVCDGVQHAHQKAIIHRDLKPSNVLIAQQDGRPVPKIIDFGIAKAMSSQLTDSGLKTELGTMMGTPEYMSPEQAELGAAGVDTRTDVYSLGVMLYETLAGALPFDSQALRETGLVGIIRTIREVEPPRPSARVTTLGDSLTDAAAKRRVEPPHLSRALRGDLDWITLKAIEKDRARRYGSPADLAADLRRYLADEPVLATPPSTAYRMRKFVRRHKVGVASAAGLAVLLVAFAVSMAVQARRIAAERDRANQEAETARQVRDFLVDLFRISDPSESLGNTITARQLLDTGAVRIRRDLADRPAIQAELMDTIGWVYRSLGLYDDAQPLLEESLAILEREFGREHPDLAAPLEHLGTVLVRRGDYASAGPVFERALALRVEARGPEDRSVASVHNNLGTLALRTGDLEAAQRHYETALAVFEAASGPDDPDVARTLSNLAILFKTAGDAERAETMYERALDIFERTFSPDHPDVAQTLNSLASLLRSTGELERARPLYERSLAIREKVLGPDHPDVARSLNNLGNLHLAIGDALAERGEPRRARDSYRAAESAHERALAIREAALGGDHSDVADSLNNLGIVRKSLGDLGGARRRYERALAIWEAALGPTHRRVAVSYYNLAGVVALQGQKDSALELLETAVDRGFSNPYMLTDPDLASVRADPRFEALAAALTERER